MVVLMVDMKVCLKAGLLVYLMADMKERGLGIWLVRTLAKMMEKRWEARLEILWGVQRLVTLWEDPHLEVAVEYQNCKTFFHRITSVEFDDIAMALRNMTVKWMERV